MLAAPGSAYTLFPKIPNAFFPACQKKCSLGVTLCLHGCLPAICVPTVFLERKWRKAEQGAGMRAVLVDPFSIRMLPLQLSAL